MSASSRTGPAAGASGGGAEDAGRFIQGGHGISFPRDELIRVMMRSLDTLGMRETAACLERESGLKAQAREAEQLQTALLTGNWAGCMCVLEQVQFVTESARQQVRFMILREKYLEMLEAQQLDAALCCLRNEFGNLLQENPELGADSFHVLASYLVCPTPEALRTVARWRGVVNGARLQLMQDICALISPSQLVKEGRLEELLSRAIVHQLSKCIYTNIQGQVFSLLEDITDSDPRSVVPQTCIHVLEDHTDEVWFVQFSTDGRYLATSSKDKCIKIYEVCHSLSSASQLQPSSTAKHSHFKSSLNRSSALHTHETASREACPVVTVRAGDAASLSESEAMFIPVASFDELEEPAHTLAWCPDNMHLLSCSSRTEIHLWRVHESNHVRTFSEHTMEVTSVCWLPSGDKFVSGSLDRSVLLWSIEGRVLARWADKGSKRVNSVALAATTASSAQRVLCVCAEKYLRELKIVVSSSSSSSSIDQRQLSQTTGHEDEVSGPMYEFVEVFAVTLEKPVMSLHTLPALCLGLINYAGGDICVLDTHNLRSGRVCVGQMQGRFMLRPSFGGTEGSFVISGSEDSRIYIWHTFTGQLLCVLQGHSGTVNTVCWRHGHGDMFASASDDHTVRIWATVRQENESRFEKSPSRNGHTNGHEAH